MCAVPSVFPVLAKNDAGWLIELYGFLGHVELCNASIGKGPVLVLLLSYNSSSTYKLEQTVERSQH